MLKPEEYDRLNKAIGLAPGTLERNRYYVHDKSLERLLELLNTPSEPRKARLSGLFCATALPLLIIVSPNREFPESDYVVLSFSLAVLAMDSVVGAVNRTLQRSRGQEIEKIYNMIPEQNRTPRL